MRNLDKDSFKKGVYDIVRCIPYGRATSYGAIAKAMGYPNLSRMVGKVMGECPDKTIPAHRVVNSQGILTAREAFGKAGEMERLLANEGITVTGNRIMRWGTIFWDPIKEINID